MNGRDSEYWNTTSDGDFTFDFTSDSAKRARRIILLDEVVNPVRVLLKNTLRFGTGDKYLALYGRMTEKGVSYAQLRVIFEELWELLEHESARRIAMDRSLQKIRSLLCAKRESIGITPVRPVSNREFYDAFLRNFDSHYTPFLIVAEKLHAILSLTAVSNHSHVAMRERFSTREYTNSFDIERLKHEILCTLDPLTFVEELIARGTLNEESLKELCAIAHERSQMILNTSLAIYGDTTVGNPYDETVARVEALLRALEEACVFAHLSM